MGFSVALGKGLDVYVGHAPFPNMREVLGKTKPEVSIMPKQKVETPRY